jgi:hypothetical protein
MARQTHYFSILHYFSHTFRYAFNILRHSTALTISLTYTPKRHNIAGARAMLKSHVSFIERRHDIIDLSSSAFRLRYFEIVGDIIFHYAVQMFHHIIRAKIMPLCDTRHRLHISALLLHILRPPIFAWLLAADIVRRFAFIIQRYEIYFRRFSSILFLRDGDTDYGFRDIFVTPENIREHDR